MRFKNCIKKFMSLVFAAGLANYTLLPVHAANSWMPTVEVTQRGSNSLTVRLGVRPRKPTTSAGEGTGAPPVETLPEDVEFIVKADYTRPAGGAPTLTINPERGHWDTRIGGGLTARASLTGPIETNPQCTVTVTGEPGRTFTVGFVANTRPSPRPHLTEDQLVEAFSASPSRTYLWPFRVGPPERTPKNRTLMLSPI
jgi:hypothetical protein